MATQGLAEYVIEHSVRGACMCGKCADGLPDAESHQPPDSPTHTVDLTFFKVARKEDNGNAEEFEALARAEFPHWFDGAEHNYLECGADIGDQGLAMQAMGLGHIYGVWTVFSPVTMFGDTISPTLAQQMAGSGYIAIQADKEKAEALTAIIRLGKGEPPDERILQ